VTVDFVPILSTIVLIATLATLILGVLSYVAFRLRERRGPRAESTSGTGKQFFVRYHDAPKSGADAPPPLA
jgi:hypothetical protein